ncbi:MAG: ABC transporter ATP-binding protein [Crocinitomicaceae bacterium]
MIKLHNCNISIGEKQLFNCPSFTLEKGQMIALLGRNGSGKSTFLRALCGFNKSLVGECWIDEKPFIQLHQKEIQKKIAYVPVKQEVFGKIRLKDLVLSGNMAERNFMDLIRKEEVFEAMKILNQLNIGHLSENLFVQLSDGEQKLGLLAKALFQDADYLFLDEPEAFLDVGNRMKMFAELQKIAQEGKSVFFSTHQPDLAKKYCTHVAFIENQVLKIIDANLCNEQLIHRIFLEN